MKTKRLSERTRAILGSCPSAGNGVHRWLFVTALKLHGRFPDKEQLVQRLDEASAGCGRDVPLSEIENAVRDSLKIVESEDSALPRTPRWPQLNPQEIDRVARGGPNLNGLAAASPVPCNENSPETEVVIDTLFPGNPLLCAGLRVNHSLTRSREEWRGFLGRQQFIVPNPMSAIRGITKNGEVSMRTLNNTGPRRFLVVEFDPPKWETLTREQHQRFGTEERYYEAKRDEHAALLAHFGSYAPLVQAVHSGGKSLHGWFYCAGDATEKVERFFRYAVSLGADPATWLTCQYVRMPGGWRDNGRQQRVVFFNPAPLKLK